MQRVDEAILNLLQEDFPVCGRPFERAAAALHLTEEELLARVARMMEQGTVTRLGPLYNAEALGGAFLLAAMSVPESDLPRVAEIVNALPEVAHNYAREHAFNMWFVLATERPEAVGPALARIERETGYPVAVFPRCREYRVRVKLDAGGVDP